jgi:hypothetical protein
VQDPASHQVRPDESRDPRRSSASQGVCSADCCRAPITRRSPPGFSQAVRARPCSGVVYARRSGSRRPDAAGDRPGSGTGKPLERVPLPGFEPGCGPRGLELASEPAQVRPPAPCAPRRVQSRVTKKLRNYPRLSGSLRCDADPECGTSQRQYPACAGDSGDLQVQEGTGNRGVEPRVAVLETAVLLKH